MKTLLYFDNNKEENKILEKLLALEFYNFNHVKDFYIKKETFELFSNTSSLNSFHPVG